MRFDEFERRAAQAWEEIPDDYRAGVDGLVIERTARRHPGIEDVYTLGECLTESYPSEYGGPDTTRSVLVLYYGSFRRVAALDPDFDWSYEIWETVAHELRHHLESLAAEDALEDVDYAIDENFKRLNDEPFDPWFYRAAEPVGPGVFDADGDIFIELSYDDAQPPRPSVEFAWRGQALAVPTPPELGDVAFIDVTGGADTGAGTLCLVLVRRRSTLASLSRWLRRHPPRIVQTQATAHPR